MRATSSPRWQFGLCLSVLLSAMIVWTGHLPLQADSDVDQDPTEPGMLVLTTGRVVTGRILRNGQDYLVRTSVGEMFVPAGFVRLRCRHLSDAYRQLRLAFPEHHGAEHHMALARWCLSQKLYAEARTEVRDAIKLEPDRAEALDMLQRLDTMVDPDRTEQRQEKPAIVEVGRQSQRLNEVESVGGLPQELASLYVNKVQHILTNNCSKAGCHAHNEEAREFRLQKFTTGNRSNRHLSERNLASILKFIDFDNPLESPLLIKPRGNHGRRGTVIFVGSRGGDQYAELRDWVLNVAANRDESANVRPRRVTTRRGGGKIRTASYVKSDGENNSAEHAEEPDLFPELSKGRRNNPKSTNNHHASDSSPVDREPDGPPTGARDPFDPAEFNKEGGK